MSEDRALGVVIGHGAMADGLVSAVKRIAGDRAGDLLTLSNDGKSPEELRLELDRMAGDARTVVFVDLQAGSCGMAALACCRDNLKRALVYGVNLPMLLDFVFSREDPLEEIVDRLVSKGRTSIGASPTRG